MEADPCSPVAVLCSKISECYDMRHQWALCSPSGTCCEGSLSQFKPLVSQGGRSCAQDKEASFCLFSNLNSIKQARKASRQKPVRSGFCQLSLASGQPFFLLLCWLFCQNSTKVPNKYHLASPSPMFLSTTGCLLSSGLAVSHLSINLPPDGQPYSAHTGDFVS